ncbi:hypothetical protein BN166_1910024 [Clostridioides difficile E10]|nr:hypothetical protein BN166_1910024 [Clostridioides difficile E10]
MIAVDMDVRRNKSTIKSKIRLKIPLKAVKME